MVVNLGTGGFIIYPTGRVLKKIPGYLSELLLISSTMETQYALEGTINGIANTPQCTATAPIRLCDADPAPVCLCSPETIGLGSPYWRPNIPFFLSKSAKTLNPPVRRRVVLVGIIF